MRPAKRSRRGRHRVGVDNNFRDAEKSADENLDGIRCSGVLTCSFQQFITCLHHQRSSAIECAQSRKEAKGAPPPLNCNLQLRLYLTTNIAPINARKELRPPLFPKALLLALTIHGMFVSFVLAAVLCLARFWTVFSFSTKSSQWHPSSLGWWELGITNVISPRGRRHVRICRFTRATILGETAECQLPSGGYSLRISFKILIDCSCVPEYVMRSRILIGNGSRA